MFGSDSFGFVDERPLVLFSQHFPFGAQTLGDFRIVHLRIVLSDFSTLQTRPDHEGVHGSLDVVGVFLLVG